jgi:hypothetical protein
MFEITGVQIPDTRPLSYRSSASTPFGAGPAWTFGLGASNEHYSSV